MDVDPHSFQHLRIAPASLTFLPLSSLLFLAEIYHVPCHVFISTRQYQLQPTLMGDNWRILQRVIAGSPH